MNRAFSISALFLIIFLMVLRCVRSADDIVQDTCKKIAANDPELSFDFCMKSLGSDSESRKVDVEGLGLIGLRLLQAKFSGTIEYIKQLQKRKSEPRLQKALSLCLLAYSTSERKDLTPFYKAKRYLDLNIWVSGMITSEDTCDTQFSMKGGMVPPLTKRNADVYQLSAIVLGIMAIL
ncbi:putative invertase inhibitor [Rhodamnia argentea]|uniref:Invertase inhibitor n=1 Tax=Rhodamnia argentea TaxID=178133 RepID=A0A8B8R0H4_9MYRT|nr:putative invertase inhibitor [Rhodamnia argentea]